MYARYIFYIIAGVTIFFYGCNSNNQTKKHEHSHEGHSHNDHDHDHGDIHENEEQSHDNKYSDEIKFTTEQAEIAGLTVETVVPGVFSQVIKTGGQVQIAQGDEVIVVSTATGTVSFLNPSITNGMAVKSGETIVTVSAKDLPEGDPATKVKIAYETALKEFQRAEGLVKDKIIPVKEYEQILMRYETAKTVYEAQATNITAKGVRVISPMTGYIKSRLVNQGEYVSVGQAIAVVSQNRRLQLRAELSESYFKNIKNIRSANFKMAYDNTVYKLQELNGRLLSFGKTSDGQSSYIPVTFEFDNVEDIIPGSFAEIYLLARPQDKVISVPVSALIEEQGLYFVYLQLDKEGYKKQEIMTGQNDGTRVEIVSGLVAGDRVVTKGVYQLKLAAVSSVMPEGHSHSH